MSAIARSTKIRAGIAAGLLGLARGELQARIELTAARHQRPDGRIGPASLSFTSEASGRDHMALLWGNGGLLVATWLRFRRAAARPSPAPAPGS